MGCNRSGTSYLLSALRTLLPTDGWKGMTHPMNKSYFDFKLSELCMELCTDSCPILCLSSWYTEEIRVTDLQFSSLQY